MMSKLQGSNNTPQRIIVIDDDFTCADVIADFLIDQDYEVKVFTSIEAAQNQVNSTDILIVDMRIGARPSAGVDFIIELRRKKSEFKKTKTIFMSNFGRRGEIKDKLDKLEDGYTWLDKPVEMTELLKSIMGVTENDRK